MRDKNNENIQIGCKVLIFGHTRAVILDIKRDKHKNETAIVEIYDKGGKTSEACVTKDDVELAEWEYTKVEQRKKLKEKEIFWEKIRKGVKYEKHNNKWWDE